MNAYNTVKAGSLVLICFGSALLFPLSGGAATFTYNGGGANVFMHDAANWAGGVAPENMENDFVISDIPDGKEAKVGVNLPGNTRSITFSESAKSMEVFGTAVANYMAFAAGGNSLTLQNNSSNTQTFSLQLRQYWIGGANPNQRTWDAANGDVVVNSSVLVLGDSAGSAAKEWRLAGARNFTFNSQIVSGGFSGGSQQIRIVKTGTGIVTLNADSSSLGGAFDVQAGTLLVQNASGSATGSGDLTVYSGARLAGTGRIGGTTILATGASLAPGGIDNAGNSTTGVLTGTSLVWNSDNSTAGIVMQLGVDEAASDKIVLTGDFFKGEGVAFIIDFSGSTLVNGAVYTLITFGATNFAVTDFVALNAQGIFEITGDSLTFTAIPEASTSFIVGGVLAGLALVSVRRKMRR